MRFKQGPPCQVPEVVKELALTRVLIIPEAKPPVHEVLDSCVDIVIEDTKLINTRIIKDGLPIKKAMISGTAKVTLKYEAAVPDQQVHAALFDMPFETLVEWPGGPEAGNPICVNVTVEHFQIELLCGKELLGVLVMRFDLYRD